MHQSAMEHGKLFFDTYLNHSSDLKILDIGAQDVNGSLRSIAPKNNEYVGVDFCEANGVDIVLDDPYVLPFEPETFDVIVSSSCYEHSEFFWLSFNEALRVLKPAGLLYINAPSNGYYHRYPLDCWRFFPDSGVALQNWANRNGYECAMLESFNGAISEDVWKDAVAVWVKDKANAYIHPNRMIKNFGNFTNGRLMDSEDILNFLPSFLEPKNKDIRLSPKQVEDLIVNIKSQDLELADELRSLLN